MGKLGNHIRRIKWAFGSGDGRRGDIEDVATEVDEIETVALTAPCPQRLISVTGDHRTCSLTWRHPGDCNWGTYDGA